ncbi:complement decay-accelerating factor, GPI-anchored-like isoform X2 [Arvicanthis niloticus]|uniref:complement decay-accelerating factor, GPI-anchored-like isoform X2 n=1 Tax=Arvicanthis niloticus TaxID=61156 RepID=UPI00402BB69F
MLLLLLLLLLSPTAQGDCGPPPDIPNATPDLSRHTTFAKNTKVTYSCNKGYKQIPGKSNIVVCLGTGEWSGNETFCNKTCNGPQRVKFATLKKEYIRLNFFPIGTTVEYKCRPGFLKVPSVSAKSTCLEELVWSPVAEFCKRKKCRNPGELQNGRITVSTDITFGSEINFSCDEGYRLVGVSSTFCVLSRGRNPDNPTVDWEDAFPECIDILCEDPPKIKNGRINWKRELYKFSDSVSYSCDKGFILVGNTSIFCTVKSEYGEWSDPPPECIEKSKITTKKPTVNVPRILSTPQNPTIVIVPSTGISPTPQESTIVNVPSTRIPPTPQNLTTVLVPATQNVPAMETTVQHPTRTSKDKGQTNSGGDHFIYGHTCLIALTVLHAMLLLIG